MAINNTLKSPTANSYVTLDFVNQYHTDRGNIDWAGTDEAKTHAIIKATDYLDRHFEFKGEKSTSEQALKFPRDLFGDVIPIEIQKAVATYSLFALRGELYDTTRTTVSGEIRKQKSKVKAGEVEEETETEFVGAGEITQIQSSQFDSIHFLIKQFIIVDHLQVQRTSSSSQSEVQRADLTTSSLETLRG